MVIFQYQRLKRLILTIVPSYKRPYRSDWVSDLEAGRIVYFLHWSKLGTGTILSQGIFHGKVDAIRATTATALAPAIEHRQVPPLATFNNVTVEEVSQILRKTPNKQCELDPIKTWLAKDNHIHGKRVFHTGLVSRLAQACSRSFKDQETFFRPTWHQVI